MLAACSVMSVLVRFVVRSFSTNSRPALRAACGRPPARQRHDAHRGTGLTLTPGEVTAVTAAAEAARIGSGPEGIGNAQRNSGLAGGLRRSGSTGSTGVFQ
jgi:hypothetical protein